VVIILRNTVYLIIVYSIAGYGLERLINLIFRGYWIDNSVLFGPYQPMYGVGVVLTLLVYQQLKKYVSLFPLQIILLIITGIVTTYMMEAVSGHMFFRMYGLNLWDYTETFSVCKSPYTCWLPTSIFGLISAFTVYYVHPFIHPFLMSVRGAFINGLIILFFIDVVLTYIGVLL